MLRKSIALTILLLASALGAQALELPEAKKNGLVGEQLNGYLAPTNDTPSAEVKALITEINNKRRNHYQGIAKRNGTPLNVVEQLAGEKAIAKTGKGLFIRKGTSGPWTKK